MVSPNLMLYFDIETRGQYQNYENFKNIDTRGSILFGKKYEKNDSPIEEVYLSKSAILPQYGSICCVSFGTIHEGMIKIKSVSNIDESKIIEECKKIFSQANDFQRTLCGYNIKNFDILWLNHKFIKYGLEIPYILRTVEKKPWEMNMFDIFDYCNSGHYTSLDETCYEFELPSPKEKLSGDKVHKTFWEGDLDLIKHYCESDVRACIGVYEKIYECNPVG